MVEECEEEKPKNWPRRDFGFHLGSFFPSCKVGSSTYEGHPHTRRRVKKVELSTLVPKNISTGLKPVVLFGRWFQILTAWLKEKGHKSSLVSAGQ